MRNRPSLLIATALAEELTPLLDTFEARLIPPAPSHGPFRFYQASVETETGATLNLIFCSAYNKGAVHMTSLLNRALDRFSPRRVVLAGIAATVPDSGVRLGDVLVARHIVDASESKLVPNAGSDRTRRVARPCDPELVTPLQAYAERTGRRDLVFGIIISQPDVVKWADARDRLAEPVRRFYDEIPIGIEMEGLGLVAAASTQPAARRPDYVLVKGAVDFANIFKNDRARREAAAKVGDFLKGFLRGGWIVDPLDSRVGGTDAPHFAAPAVSDAHYGREQKRGEMIRDLQSPYGARVIWVEGLGGIGKTTLAEGIWSEAQARGLFAGGARYNLQPLCEVADQPRATAPVEAIVSAFISQLGLKELSHLPWEAQRDRFLEAARAKNFLFLVDNLEATADVAKVSGFLSYVDQYSTSRWIVTSRVAPDENRLMARIDSLEELSEPDSIRFMSDLLSRSPLRASPVEANVLKRIYDVVGGNMLALKLSVGLMSRYPPQIVVDILRHGLDRADTFYNYIYRTAWATLDENARDLLISLRMMPVGGIDWERMEAVSGFDSAMLTTSVGQLITLNLLNVRRSAGVFLYSVHRLTATFAQEIASTWRAGELEAKEKEVTRRGLLHTLARLRGASDE